MGTLFTPAPRADGLSPPVVVVLNGSGGGINEPRAALYASHGYAALALAYFKAPGLSDYISNTPLEYFERGLDWLRASGVDVIDLHDQECIDLLGDYIRANPEVWNEDIGED